LFNAIAQSIGQNPNAADEVAKDQRSLSFLSSQLNPHVFDRRAGKSFRVSFVFKCAITTRHIVPIA
jgi:hypothetical protein